MQILGLCENLFLTFDQPLHELSEVIYLKGPKQAQTTLNKVWEFAMSRGKETSPKT